MTLERDDELLTALSQGVRPDPDDPIIELLADWHADISTPLPATAPARTRRRFLRPFLVAAAAAVFALGGTAALAATAQPGSPLWPITKIIYPDRADSRTAAKAAQRLLDQAATAIAEHRYPDALAALTAARPQIDLVTDRDTRQRLEDRWVLLRAALISLSPGTPIAAPTPPGTAGNPGTAPSPAPSHTYGGGGVVPPLPLPSLPLPSLPVSSSPLPSLPLPSLPLTVPSILPSLPLP
jgi:hypothetical protein